MSLDNLTRPVSAEDSELLHAIVTHMKSPIPHLAQAREAAGKLRDRGLSVTDVAALTGTDPGVLFPHDPVASPDPTSGVMQNFIGDAD